MRMFRKILGLKLRRAAREEEGSATIPFVMFVPAFMVLVCSSVELGFVLMRQVLLERGVDLTVRDLRIGTNAPQDHEEVKERVCEYAAMIPNCMSVMHIQLRPVSTATWEPLTGLPLCVNRAEVISTTRIEYDRGAGDELMLIRACVKYDPVFPMTGLGLRMPRDNTGAYTLIATSAFVNEPEIGG